MSKEFEGLAEVQARFYFRDFFELIRELHAGQRSFSSGFSSLQKEYDALVPRCRLRLYAHCRPSYGPVALHWGLIIALRPSRRSLARRVQTERKVPHYLKRPFNPGWVYTLAKRSDLVDRFVDFDRRSLALNAAAKVFFRAHRHLKTSTLVKFSPNLSPAILPSLLNPGTSREVPKLPVDLTLLDLPAEYRQFLRSGWLASYTLALAEEEGYELVREVSSNPSAEGIRLELLDRNSPSLTRHLAWIHASTERSFPSLFHRHMAQLGIREAVRPVLTQKEIKRRQIEGRLQEAAKALNLVREKCRAAQLALTAGLAEARMTLHWPPDSAPAPALPSAG